MIRHEHTHTILRFYPEFTDDPYAPYVAVCTLVWETPQTVWIHGLHGTITRRSFRQLADFCVVHGITTVKAHRHPTRKLPCGVPVGDHIEIRVADVVGRSRADRAFAPNTPESDT